MPARSRLGRGRCRKREPRAQPDQRFQHVGLRLTAVTACLAIVSGFSTPFRIRRSTRSLRTAGLDSGLGGNLDTSKRKRRVRFLSPLLEYGYPPAVEDYESGDLDDKPLLLYLPGFDGTFLAPFLQFPELDTIFDVRCMSVAMEDRSTFEELKESVLEYLRDNLLTTDVESPPVNATQANRPKRQKQPRQKRRPFYLAGESFGGILASEIALDLRQDKIFTFRGLALINPATCYDRSRLAMDGPGVASSQPWLYFFNLLRLLPLFTDEYSVDQLLLILRAKALPSVIDDARREAYLGRVAFSLPFVLPVMTQGALQWRLSEWLDKGAARMTTKIQELASRQDSPLLPILVVVGENDATLPSIDEAERLAGILEPQQLTVHVVEGAGHASTCGSRVDLAALFRQTFPELRRQRRRRTEVKDSSPRWPWRKGEAAAPDKPPPRTAMKAVAAKGKGKYFGMEPRYDNAAIGLSPLLYWSPACYKKFKPKKDRPAEEE
jgi:pimeloyl-ACP methyl ester carboxylesterase